MNDKRANDEQLLIDFLLGRSSQDESRFVRQRLARDDAFRRLHDDIANTFAAMRLLPEVEPPDGLVERTLEQVRIKRQTDALLASQKPARRVLLPTFSLREIAVLAAAAVVLLTVFVPSVYMAKARAQRGQCASNVGQIGAAIQAHASANKGLLPAIDGGGRWLAGDGQPVVSNSAALFKLVSARYASPVSFQCPAVGGGSFVMRAGMTDFPQARFISYSYQHTSGPVRPTLNDPALQEVKEQMAILADSTPLFDGTRFRPDRLNASAGDNHGGAGQNVLYLDMHVEWHSEASAGVHGDNIFLAGDIRHYRGTEVPTRPDDTFLLPSFSDSSSLP